MAKGCREKLQAHVFGLARFSIIIEIDMYSLLHPLEHHNTVRQPYYVSEAQILTFLIVSTKFVLSLLLKKFSKTLNTVSLKEPIFNTSARFSGVWVLV